MHLVNRSPNLSTRETAGDMGVTEEACIAVPIHDVLERRVVCVITEGRQFLLAVVAFSATSARSVIL